MATEASPRSRVSPAPRERAARRARPRRTEGGGHAVLARNTGPSWRVRLRRDKALILMTLSIGCLIAPSMQHRIVEAGQSTWRLEQATTLFAAWSLLPMALSLGIALFAVCERIFGIEMAIAMQRTDHPTLVVIINLLQQIFRVGFELCIRCLRGFDREAGGS